MSSAGSAPHAVLKSETASFHRELDATPLIEELMRRATIPTYLKFLAAMAELHRYVASGAIRDLTTIQRMHPKLDIERRSRAFHRDVDAVRQSIAQEIRLSFCEPQETIFPNISAALGALYVAEGSTIGSKHVLRALSAVRDLFIPASIGLRGYGPDTGAAWAGFCRVLDISLGAEPQLEEAVATAQATFRYASKLMNSMSLEA